MEHGYNMHKIHLGVQAYGWTQDFFLPTTMLTGDVTELDFFLKEV
jgi:hypothetical protein